MNFLKALLFLLVIVFSLQSYSQLTEKNYKIYSSKLGTEVSISKIVEEMKGYDVLFFGEEHNDSVTHYLEAKMLELLSQQFAGNVALSLEMFERDVQTVMNEYLKGGIREKNFLKDARVWSNYKDYKPMVEFAKANNIDIICANSPSRYTNLAARKGQQALMELSEESKKNFAPLPYDTATGNYYDKLQQMSGHGNATTDTSKKMPASMSMGSFNLIVSQSLWDATMAWSISQYLKKQKGKKLLQVNGRFHSDEGFAIVTQLKKYSPKLKALVISSGTDDAFPIIDWSKHKHFGDYIIITDPNVPKSFNE